MTSLYLISPPNIDLDVFPKRLERAFRGGELGAFQLRLKDVDDEVIGQAIEVIMPICRAHNTQFILNDRPDLAKRYQVDGVHLGQKDADIGAARALLGTEKVIGASCYNSTDRAIDAGTAGADYVSFGAFYPTKTKKDTVEATPNLLHWWSENSTLPCVAIGGIHAGNCRFLVEAGADFVAVVSAVWDEEGREDKAVNHLLKLL